MARHDSRGFWNRFLTLVGVFLFGCLALAWQWRNVDWKEQFKALNPDTRQLLQTPYAAELDELIEVPLKKARAKSKAIAALCQERKASNPVPDLGVPAASAPATGKASPETTETFRNTQVQFRLRELSAYQKLTADTGKAKAAGERFLQQYLTQFALPNSRSRDISELDRLGRAAEDAGSHDPLVQTYNAHVLWMATSDAESAKRMWIDALPVLQQSKYPRAVELNARLFLRDLLKSKPFDRQLEPFRPFPVALVVEALQEEGTSGEWRASLCERAEALIQQGTNYDQEAVLIGLLKSESVDEYLLHYLVGTHYITLAWTHRGNGFADTVSEEQWKQFRLHAQVASDHLQYAWFLQPDLPYAPHSLIRLGMARQGTKADAHFWFLRTVEARFDYYEAYWAMMNALLPRWGGSHEQMLAFARDCFKTDRFDTLVPYVAVDVLTFMRDEDRVNLRAVPGATQLLRDFTTQRNAYRARLPEARMYEDKGSFRSELVQLLEDCQLLDLAAAEYHAAGDKIHWTQLRYNERPARYLAARLIASQGPAGNRVLAFDEKLRAPWDIDSDPQRLDALTREYQTLTEGIPADDASRVYFAHAGVILDQLRQFSNGEWTELRIGKQLEGWEPYCDTWSTHDDGSVELACRLDDARQVNLRPLANFQPPFETEVTIELLDPPPYPYQPGIGWFKEGPRGNRTMVTSLKFMIEASDYQLEGQPVARRDFLKCLDVANYRSRYGLNTTGPHSLRLKLWNDTSEFCVDETAWVTPSLAKPWNRQGYLCFGVCLDRVSRGALRLSQIRIRQLRDGPAPAETEPFEVRLKYWEARAASNRGFDPVTMGRLCRLRYEQGRYEDVIAMADDIMAQRPGINDVLVWKARALIMARHEDLAALKLLEDMLRTQPRDDEEAVSTIAEIYAMTGNDAIRNGQTALTHARFAVNTSGQKHARALAALAAAHAELGEFDQAITTLKQAFELASEPEKAEWEPRMQAYLAGTAYRFPQPPQGS